MFCNNKVYLLAELIYLSRIKETKEYILGGEEFVKLEYHEIVNSLILTILDKN